MLLLLLGPGPRAGRSGGVGVGMGVETGFPGRGAGRSCRLPVLWIGQWAIVSPEARHLDAREDTGGEGHGARTAALHRISCFAHLQFQG